MFNTFPAPQVVAPQPQNYPNYPMTTPGVMPPTQGPLILPQPNGTNPNMPQSAPYPGAPTAPYGVATPGQIPQPQQPGQPPKRPGPGER